MLSSWLWLLVFLHLTISLAEAENSKLQPPKVHVVTVATEETDGLKRLARSAERFDIRLEVFGLGQEWKGGDTRVEQGGGQKIRILRDELKRYKDEENTIIMFVDAYDVIFNAQMDVILDRFLDHYADSRVLFGAEPFCWPDESLAVEYPLIEFGKRYLNSGLFMGYAPEIYKILTINEIGDKDDDQLYFTMIYLDEKLRKELKISLDSMSRIFQNLNGVTEDIELEFVDGAAQVYNNIYNTHPVVVHGNGPSKKYLNYLGNYIAQQWSATKGCFDCGDKSHFDFKDVQSEDDYPMIVAGIFIAKPIPFIEEVLNAFAALNYPKKKIALYLYNSQAYNIKDISEFIKVYSTDYYTKKVINFVAEMGEREAREEFLAFASKHNPKFVFMLDGDALLRNEETLKELIEKALNNDIGIIAPLLRRTGALYTNFWGDIAPNGYYKRSEDYFTIIDRKRIGHFNVPFITAAVLIRDDKFALLKKPFSYNMEIDPDMSFCQWARDNGHFMYVTNENVYGQLIISDDFEHTVQDGVMHAEMWGMFDNRNLWEERYIHPEYYKQLEPDFEVEQACPDVYDFPLMSERYCKEMIEEMEHYGKWSDGSNQDKRITGGYENVPTRDIHMNQIGYERQWLYFLDEFVRPLQEKVFIGYYHKPIESHMMFVVRYKPDEQPALRPHQDASTYSIDIALNRRGVDYEGGGVRYLRYNCTVPADRVGYSMLFPGRLTHMHEGLPTTSGTRYILVSFINP